MVRRRAAAEPFDVAARALSERGLVARHVVWRGLGCQLNDWLRRFGRLLDDWVRARTRLVSVRSIVGWLEGHNPSLRRPESD